MKQAVGLMLLGLGLLASCSLSSGDPRDAVIKFLNAVNKSDTLSILQGFTLAAPYTILPDTGLWPAGDARNDTLMATRLLGELTPGGTVFKRWKECRMVVGNAEVRGDSAKVEVTRLDQVKGVQVYNKFGVVKGRGTWRIYSFGTEQGPGL
jgi:hypothetical protein